MGFFYASNKADRNVGPSKQSVDLLHRAGCQACPLDKAKCKNPKMEPSGEGSVYILGANPTGEADRKGYPLVGAGKDALIESVPNKYRGDLRYNNIVRTAAGQNLTSIMIECCRPSIIADIEEFKPKAIIGLGEDVLRWMLPGMSRITKWTGRHIPVKIGEHVCWFMPISDPVEILKTKRFDWADSEEQFAWKLQVKKAFALIESLPDAPEPHTKEQARADITYIDGSNGEDDLDRLEAFLAKADKEGHSGFDYETNRLRGYNKGSKLLSVGIGLRDETLALALSHRQTKWSKKLLKEVYAILADWLMTTPSRKISHNLGFELEWTGLEFGREFVRSGRWEDTQTQAWLLDERQNLGKPDAHSLEFLCMQYFGINIKALNVLETDDLDNSPLELVLEYQGIDAKYHRKLFLKQSSALHQAGLLPQYENMLSRIATCVLTQIKGVPISQAQVGKFKKFYENNIGEVEAEIASTAAAKLFKKRFAKPFEPSNNKDVLALITEILKEDATNKKEKQSSGLEVLERIDDPIAPLILEHRSLAKGLSTYVLPVYAGDKDQPRSEHLYEDGLIHPTISTTKTDTSRTASDKPNSQNWPKHKATKIVRAQIEPEYDDERIVSFDFAGIQARNIAMESLDDSFIKTFWTGYDPHAAWAKWFAEQAETDWKFVHQAGSVKSFFDKKNSTIFKAARSKIKNGFVFPTFFGAQPRGIAVALDIDQDIVTNAQEALFEEFPGVKVWQDSIKDHYQEHGWISGLTGIRHRAPRSPNQLINAPIQADEAWIVCDAFTRISKLASQNDALHQQKAMDGLRKRQIDRWNLQPNMEIHDDLTFIWRKRDIDYLAPIIITAMLAVPFKWAHVVPIEIEMSVGTNWSNCVEVGKFRSDTWTDLGYKRADYA